MAKKTEKSGVTKVAKVKNPAVKSDVFIAALLSGVAAGLSNRKIAESIGMTESTFNVRSSQLRKKTAEQVAAKKAAGDTTVVNPFDSLPARSRAKVDYVGLVTAQIEKNKALVAAADAPAKSESVEGEKAAS